MQLPPLTFSDISLLLTVGTIILLIAVEISSNSYGKTNHIINKKKLRNAAFVTSALFFVTVGIRIIGIIIGF
jgi:hypothetical protein